MRKLLLLFLSIIFCSTLNSQDLNLKDTSLPCLNKKFTIVAHMVRDTAGDPNLTQANILEGIDHLNDAFSPICVSFEICEFRYIDNFQYNVVGGFDWQEMQVKYNLDNRINMYIVGEVISNPSYCGFATQGGITNLNSGGLMIEKWCASNPKGMAHEMGHYFGLLNTYEGHGVELVDESNCSTEGDLLCDTPSDPYHKDSIVTYVNYFLNCRFVYTGLDANGQYYEPDVGNIMSNYSGDCTCGFSNEQYLKMVETYESGPGMW